MSIKKLTQKQYHFVSNYTRNGFNASQAARDAGYSQKYAESQSYNLVNHPVVSAHLSHAYEEAEMATEVTFQWRIDKLKQIIKSCENSLLAQDKRVMIAAIAELNKMTGEYAPNKKVSLTIDATAEKLVEARRQYEEY